MLPAPFALERYFARYEFSARYLLSASDCQGPAMAELVAAAEDELRAGWDRLQLGYTESQGLPELRAEIAGLYGHVEPDQVVVAAPEEAIFLTMNALLSPGDHVVCTFPGYQSLYELARAIGCEVDLWEPEEVVLKDTLSTDARDGERPRWRFDPVRLEALLRSDTRLVVCNFPHNPTGALPTPADFARMVGAVSESGAWLFSDEMYRLLERDPGLRLPPAIDLHERAVSLAGMSKAFGLAGLRIGWVAIRDRSLLQRVSSLKDYTTICSSAPSELLALMALRSRDGILATNLDRIERNRTTAATFFERHSGLFRWVPPQAGTVCFPRLLGAEGTALDTAERPAAGAEAFCARVLEATGALLLPSTVYGYGDSHFRLGLGRKDFDEGLAALEAFLEGAETAG